MDRNLGIRRLETCVDGLSCHYGRRPRQALSRMPAWTKGGRKKSRASPGFFRLVTSGVLDRLDVGSLFALRAGGDFERYLLAFLQ